MKKIMFFRPIVCEGLNPETDSLPKQHTPLLAAGLLIFSFFIILASCSIPTTPVVSGTIPPHGFTQARGNTLAEQLDWIKTNGIENGRYNIAIRVSEIVNNTQHIYFDDRKNIHVRIGSTGHDRWLFLGENTPTMFEVRGGAVLILESITLVGVDANNSPVVKVHPDGEAEMRRDSVITGNGSDGVIVHGGFFAMYNNSRIHNNNRGVWLQNNAEMFMTEVASIYDNKSVNYGGGVFIDVGSFLDMRGNATIRNNSAHYGGGVAIGAGGLLNMHSIHAEIRGNNASTGGGVHIADHGNLKMYGGAIKGNTASTNNANLFIDALGVAEYGIPNSLPMPNITLSDQNANIVVDGGILQLF